MGDREIAELDSDHFDEVMSLWIEAGLKVRRSGRDSPGEFARQLSGGWQTVLGLRLKGVLTGVALATHDGRKGWINRVAVHPDHRRRGHAQALIAEAEGVLRREGMRVIAVLIEAWNESSIRLFEAAGYANAGDSIVYLSKREDEKA